LFPSGFDDLQGADALLYHEEVAMSKIVLVLSGGAQDGALPAMDRCLHIEAKETSAKEKTAH